MILQNKTDFMQVINGQKVRKKRTVIVPEDISYDKNVWDLIEEYVKPTKKVK